MSEIMEVKVIRRRPLENRSQTAPSATPRTLSAATPLSSASLMPTGTAMTAAVCPEREKCRELLETMIQGLVDHPESIKVSYSMGDRTTVYKVDCDQKCLGQIIGAKGKNISGVRAVIAATMARKGIRAIVEIPYYSLAT